EEPLAPEWAGDRVRDLYEIELLWECVIQGKPVLGLCRGAQIINVAFGGTLYQDIATQLPDAIRHVDRAIYDELVHEVALEPGSQLARLYPDLTGARVTSIHHQCVKEIGNGLVVEACSPVDGVIEAIRYTGAGDAMGVQWHPEFHLPGERMLLDSGPLLYDFLRRAEEYRD
ncbi:MAG TPA: gamma-glutamyl-gamma-aminobutyrate hydrolase family protein, partial [Gemmatimonadaceae bacterium]